MDGRDWTPFEEAGLVPVAEPDRAARLDLLEFLLAEGCSLEEMVDADRRGRLFGLAGDRIAHPGAGALTLADVAAGTGGDLALVRRLWRALGLPGGDGDERVASADDVGALGPLVVLVGIAGEDLALELARTIGASLFKIADVTNSVGRSSTPLSAVATSDSELETARYWAGIAPLIPALGNLLDVLIRHHLDLAREHFERTDSYDVMHRRLIRLAVGFVDLSGFTSATERLGEQEFARMLTSFSSRVGDTVGDLGGRVVKFVGDAAMIVAPDVPTLATIATALVESWTAVGDGMTLHAGLAHGELLSQDADYFGSAVNLASRLSALAEPGTILASAAVGDALVKAGWTIDWLDPRPIRGFEDPVVTCVVHPR
jgi:adenylate cyclase